jgi:hypothetical protein
MNHAMKIVVALAFAVWALVVLSSLIARTGVTEQKEGTVSGVAAGGVSAREAGQH